MNFEWDEEKNIANKRKHGISFEVATLAFRDEYRLEEYDEVHSYDEDRYNIIGMVHKLIYVVYTERENDTIRIISARLATATERKRYYGGD